MISLVVLVDTPKDSGKRPTHFQELCVIMFDQQINDNNRENQSGAWWQYIEADKVGHVVLMSHQIDSVNYHRKT